MRPPSLPPKAICGHYIHELPALQSPVRSSHLEILQKTGQEEGEARTFTPDSLCTGPCGDSFRIPLTITMAPATWPLSSSYTAPFPALRLPGSKSFQPILL